MEKKKKTINHDKTLKKEFHKINQRLIMLNNGISYLINLILMEKIEGDASGDIPKELKKKIKEPKSSYFG